MPSGDDLSDYERLRLENIRRNAEFLAGLGITEEKKVREEKALEEKRQSIGKRKREDFETRKREEQPVRRSLRVQLHQDGLQLSDTSNEEGVIAVRKVEEKIAKRYSDLPLDSNELDDFEFQVFVSLKAWRLLKSREYGIESYKICQNRTLAEMVRRRRNSPEWVSADKSENEREIDLLQCWGIGPSKAKKDGYGDLLMQEIDSSEKSLDFLDKSRENGDNFPMAIDDDE